MKHLKIFVCTVIVLLTSADELPGTCIQEVMYTVCRNLQSADEINTYFLTIRQEYFEKIIRRPLRIEIVESDIEELNFTKLVVNDLVQTLDIGRSRIGNIPGDALFGMERLKAISLTENQLGVINPRAFSIVSVEYFEVINNTIQTFPANFVDGMTSLKDLRFFRQPIDLNDQNLTNFTQLQILEFSECKLKVVSPDAFKNLSKVTKLILRDNIIEVLPEDVFSDLVSMKDLQLQVNNISVVTQTHFSTLKNLVQLNLEHNNIKYIPQNCLAFLPRLSVVNFAHNEISEVNESTFNGSTAITQIYLHQNYIKQIPGNLFKGLLKLSVLKLSDNRIENIEAETFSGLRSLKTLIIARNRIISLHVETFYGLNNLYNLDLSYNEIRVMSRNMFDGLRSLRHLNLDGNGISNETIGIFWEKYS